MKIKIIESKENPLLERKEIKLEVEADITPSRDDVRKFISEELKTSEENIKVINIIGSFGVQKFHSRANIYSSKEALEKTELMRKRDKLPEKVEGPSNEGVEQSVEEKKEEGGTAEA